MKNRDIIIDRFDWPKIRRGLQFPLLTVYNSPKDYPGKFVARVFDLNRATKFVFLAGSYVELVDRIPIQQMTRTVRHPSDDPAIVEVWI